MVINPLHRQWPRSPSTHPTFSRGREIREWDARTQTRTHVQKDEACSLSIIGECVYQEYMILLFGEQSSCLGK